MSYSMNEAFVPLEARGIANPPPREEGEVFEDNFGPQAYMERYYPSEIDVPTFVAAMQTLQRELRNGDGRIDTNSVTEMTGLDHEAVETLMIFDFQRRVAAKLLEQFPEDNITVLDVGGGPTIYQDIAMALVAGDITHAEFLEQNREEVEAWLAGEGYDWDAYFALTQQTFLADTETQTFLESQVENGSGGAKNHAHALREALGSTDVELLKDRLRVAMQKVVPCDVFRADLGMESEETYDAVDASSREFAAQIVTSNFTIESATADRGKWEDGMKNIMKKTDRFLSVTAIRDAEWYHVGDKKLPAVPVNEHDIRTILEENGFRILEVGVLYGRDKEEMGYNGIVQVFAERVNQ